MSTGERIWDDLVALEKKFWNREDYSEEDKDDKAILKAIEIEGVDYCALCWDCVDELKKKGAKACGTE